MSHDLTPDQEALLSRVMTQAIREQLSDEKLEKLFSTFVVYTPPQYPDIQSKIPDVRIGFIIAGDPLTGGGTSRKPGNLIFNWKKLFDVGPSLLLTGATTAKTDMANEYCIWVLAALCIYSGLLQLSTTELTEAEACVMLALWRKRNQYYMVGMNDGWKFTNEVLTERSRPSLTLGQYSCVLSKLVKLRCIEIKDGDVVLLEEVRVDC